MTFDGTCERGEVQRAPQEIEERSPGHPARGTGPRSEEAEAEAAKPVAYWNLKHKAKGT
jgi:hypothetical protein